MRDLHHLSAGKAFPVEVFLDSGADMPVNFSSGLIIHLLARFGPERDDEFILRKRLLLLIVFLIRVPLGILAEKSLDLRFLGQFRLRRTLILSTLEYSLVLWSLVR